MSSRSLQRMLAALCEDSLDAAGIAELSRRLEADSAARRVYLEYMDLHGRLITQPQLLGAGREPGGRRAGAPLWSIAPVRFAAGVAAMIAVGAVIALAVYMGRGAAQPVEAPRPSRPIAVLVAASDAVWNSDPLVPGAALPPQTIDLASGTLEIDFLGGATVNLIGPARLSLDTNRRSRLALGQMVARLPHGASGFEVHTPGARVVDLGTEFEVSVDERGDSVVSVLDGRVELTVLDELGASAQTFELTVGGSARVVDGRAIVGDVRPDPARTGSAAVYRASVLADAPRAYWPLEEPTGASEAVDASGNGYTGVNRGASFGVEGPMDRPAAAFDGRASIDAGVRPEFGFTHDFTVEAWVWIEPNAKDLGTIVSATQADGAKLVGGWVAAWSAPVGTVTTTRLLLGNQRSGSLELHDPPMKSGRWHHVAMSIAPDDTGRLYIDGELKLMRRFSPAIPDITTLTIGRYAGGYGGWRGRLAHVAIYDRQLPDERIAAHYHAGRAH